MVSLLMLGIAGFQSAAQAFPQINTTNSETVSTVPPRYRVSFTVKLAAPGSFNGFNIQTGTGPVVHFYGSEAPPATWNAGTAPDNTVAYFGTNGWLPESTTAFAVVADQPVPCVRFIFEDPILSKVPTSRLADSYVVEGCLQVDAPTPTRALTWGGVKATYR